MNLWNKFLQTIFYTPPVVTGKFVERNRRIANLTHDEPKRISPVIRLAVGAAVITLAGFYFTTLGR